MSAEKELAEVMALATRSDASLSVCLASEVVKGQSVTLAALNITQPLQDSFRKVVTDHVQKIATLKEDGDLDLLPFEAGTKLDSHELEFLDAKDIETITDRLTCIPSSFVAVPFFVHNDHFVKGLKFYVMSLEAKSAKRVLFFRKYNAQSELSRSRLFAALFAGGQFDRISQPTLLFDQQVDCFARETTLFVSRKHDFQTIFGYFEHIEQKAHKCLDAIQAVLPIVNFEVFAESCGSHQQKMMKLANIAASAYLKSVKMKDIRKVINRYKLPGVKIITKDGIEQLEFDPKHRWVILKLLNDDYLDSVMTKNSYEVNSKRTYKA
jgi:hypothetical protein